MNGAEMRAVMARTGVTNRAMSKELGISEQAFYNKLRGKTEFKNSEIKKIAAHLKLTMTDVNVIFFDWIVN